MSSANCLSGTDHWPLTSFRPAQRDAYLRRPSGRSRADAPNPGAGDRRGLSPAQLLLPRPVCIRRPACRHSPVGVLRPPRRVPRTRHVTPETIRYDVPRIPDDFAAARNAALARATGDYDPRSTGRASSDARSPETYHLRPVKHAPRQGEWQGGLGSDLNREELPEAFEAIRGMHELVSSQRPLAPPGRSTFAPTTPYEGECYWLTQSRRSPPGTSASSLEADESPDGHRRSCDASWHSWSPPWDGDSMVERAMWESVMIRETPFLRSKQDPYQNRKTARKWGGFPNSKMAWPRPDAVKYGLASRSESRSRSGEGKAASVDEQETGDRRHAQFVSISASSMSTANEWLLGDAIRSSHDA